MARLTVHLPDTLHDRLVERADEKGVPLNQYLVFLLSQASTLDSVRVQRERFDKLRVRLLLRDSFGNKTSPWLPAS
jgi:hypothetical protein